MMATPVGPEATRRAFAPTLLAVTLLTSLLWCAPARAQDVTLWHSYQGDERRALEQLITRFNGQRNGVSVKSLWVPYSAFIRRLNQAIPRGHGPDLFIFAHEHLGNWIKTKRIAPLPMPRPGQFLPTTLDALRFGGKFWGLPLAFKSAVLFYNRKLIHRPPRNTREMIQLALRLTDRTQHRYGLVYKSSDFYFHAAWIYGFGGKLFDARGRPQIDDPNNARSLAFVVDLIHKHKITPRRVDGALVTQLFNSGLAAMVINGPWFLGEIKGIDFGVVSLPVVSETGKRPRPFATVDALFLSRHARHRAAALRVMRSLTNDESALVRAKVGKQLVANRASYRDPEIARNPTVRVFREQLGFSVPMPNRPEMRYLWEPANRALRKVIRGSSSPSKALKEAQRRIEWLMQPAPARTSAWPYALALGLVLFGLVLLWIRRLLDPSVRAQMRTHRAGYAFVAPAAFTLIALLILPFAMGALVAFFAYNDGKFTFVGATHFVDILLSKQFGFGDPLGFYYTFAVTVLWTALNIVAHVVIGVSVAMLLRDKWVKLRAAYRVLFILPWAIPNYITALVWHGIFDEEFGTMNALLQALGAEPVSWFSHFWTAFSANLVTNMWLGFPFFMVVTLGALQSIPSDLEEAASVDGASRWDRFRHIVLPLLTPALIPAIVMGTVWTFNMFNVIYLVSGGEPDGSTEILISEAYKWAFDRYERYGYASAYALVIFAILLVYARLSRRAREAGGAT